MSFLILIGLLWLVTGSSLAQTYSNDWISYSQDYWKLSVAQDGLYKVTQSELANVGLSGVDPRNLQLFHRGKEMAIVVEGEEDGSFDAADYILFLGQRNDGTLDKELYVAPEAQPHNGYNLFSDSSAYFLTVNNSQPGKRVQTFNNDPTGLPEAPFHIDEKVVLYTQNYWKGREYSADTYLSQYDFGEGWTGTHFRGGQFRDISFSGIIQTYQTTDKPQLELVLTGRNANLHSVEILIGATTASLRKISDFQFVAHENHRVTLPIEWSDISATGQIVVRVAVKSTAVTDYISIASVKLRYNQTPNMQGVTAKKFILPTVVSSSKITVSNVTGSPFVYNISDPHNISELSYGLSGSNLATVVSPGTSSLFVSGQLLSVPRIKAVDFQNIDPSSANFLIISNRKLMTPVGDVSDPVAAYAAYRSSSAGGSYSPLVTEVQQLFDQFNYGETSPRALREYARFMYDNGDPQYMFIIGKGLSVIYDYYRKGPSGTYHDLVPTFGEPGSDIAYTAGLEVSQPHIPAIPIGRLTAETAQHVVNYLEKVKEMEGVPFDALWRKNLVHLSGGATESELITFKKYVNDFKVVAEGHFLGGKVLTKSKNSNQAVELINIAEEVNKGLALVTFFGHSGTISADIEIGYASEDIQGYRNKGKYPFILVNGCDAGNIYANVYTFGQDWIITADRGAICFIAHSARGLSSNLKRYTDKFYATAFGDSLYINKSIGITQQRLISEYFSNFLSSPAHVSQVQQMILQGDPAVKLFEANKPDFAIESKDMSVGSFDEKKVSALSDSLYVEFIVKNFGITSKDTLHVQLRREMGDNSSLYYDTLYSPVLYADTLRFVVQNSAGNDNFGNNIFEISVDYINSVDEGDENNNTASIEYFIPLGGTTNLYPPNYSILSQGKPDLIAQSNDILEDSRNYLFELDTASTFDSPYLKTYSVSADGLASWKPELLENLSEDSIVYYWRTKFANPKPNEDLSWSESSFVYIKDSPEGWAQTKSPQFSNSFLHGFELETETKNWKFQQNEVPVKVVTYGIAHQNNYNNVQVYLNNTPVVFTTTWKLCRNNAIGAIAIDKSSLDSYLLYGKTAWNDPIACGREPFVINNFNNNEIVNNLRLNAYLDAIPEGDYVILFSFGSNSYQSWPQQVKDALMTIGASQATLDNLVNGEPYVLIGKKGGNALKEIRGATTDEIIVEEMLTGSFDSGIITSSKIGPAKSWGSMFTEVKYSANPVNDQFSYDVIGLDLFNNETILMQGLTADEVSLETIPADTYPLLKIKMHISDEVNLTPVQLKKWLVLYEPMPEGVLLLDDAYKAYLPKIDRAEGEELEMGYVFQNISTKDFEDSLTVKYVVYNQQSKTTEEKSLKIPSLDAKDTVMFKVPVNTVNKGGLNNLTVEVNPRIIPELNYTNNSIDLTGFLQVKGDLQHPTIDVAFDGEYIMDGDIVSPDPLILVMMKDDNAMLKKTDTVGVELMLKRPCESCSFEKVNFSSPNLVWTPATDDSDFKVEYKPGTLEDGVYSLKVQAADGSNNKSGVKPYSINFEVVNESTVTNFYPYPNPFSTSTKFVFTLTGKDVPDQIKIQIMTVTGKIVREITQDELGPIKIGNNISDFTWNGKDEFGDQLANGVYLYRVFVVNKGDKLKHRETSADRAFKNGFGKMYLLR